MLLCQSCGFPSGQSWLENCVGILQIYIYFETLFLTKWFWLISRPTLKEVCMPKEAAFCSFLICFHANCSNTVQRTWERSAGSEENFFSPLLLVLPLLRPDLAVGHVCLTSFEISGTALACFWGPNRVLRAQLVIIQRNKEGLRDGRKN